MLLNSNDSLLLIIDMQEKLLPAIFEHPRLLKNCLWILELVRELDIPVLASEQYPKGLGHTVKSLRDLLSEVSFLSKQSFSCWGDAHCAQTIKQSKKKQIVIVGIEAHVCVLQTALDLIDQQKQVFVVPEAISSRHPDDKIAALDRMRRANVQFVTKEMLFFEWLKTSANDRFKELTKRFIV